MVFIRKYHFLLKIFFYIVKMNISITMNYHVLLLTMLLLVTMKVFTLSGFHPYSNIVR